MITTELPGGFTVGTAEMFGQDNILSAVIGGKTIVVTRHKELRSKIFRHMIARPNAHKSILKWVGSNVDDQINRYGLCLWGAFDMKPDMDEKGDLSHPEFVQCSLRGRCPYENSVCRSVSCTNNISISEAMILPYVLFADRIIGQYLNRSPFTVKTQIKSIKKKLNIQTKAQLIDWAKDNGIKLCK
jgi:hypothetical protein